MRLSITDAQTVAWLEDMITSAFIAVSDKLYTAYNIVDDLPLKYQEVIKNAVIVAYNQQGAEGQKNVSSDSISQTFAQSDMYEYIDKAMPCKVII